ncbi:MAG: 2-oxoglutarate dehydrogenase complex dihydrolipoyllysine-residue succinyltransferase, partial [Bacteroidales bacterium]|nr:2-oxoglutarate dehydrogenase complex dihydrolipoyllysine-residue succinyltransferase [Bacteroidales bacterium]
MIIAVKIPSAGESVTEAAIGNWISADGSYVEKDDELAEVETDKATLPLIAPESGRLTILVKAGQKISVGEVACTIDTDSRSNSPVAKKDFSEPKPVPPAEPVKDIPKPVKTESSAVKTTPLARSIMHAHNLDIDDIINGLRKITRQEVEMVVKQSTPAKPSSPIFTDEREIERRTMSPLRRKLSKRLVAVKNETAMLTTFNEVDMSRVMQIRKQYQDRFISRHGQKIGMVSFFAKAATIALHLFPRVNSIIDGDDEIVPNYTDVGIAVQTDKGLMVPVIRNAHLLSLPQIEIQIAALAAKARASKLSIEEMTGGTFTITNGGIFGSMLSTPILNPPQSAILGMHNIVDRPVAINGTVQIRPIMYVALSYDHRMIDGRDSVGFLSKIKELVEEPVKMSGESN